MTVERFGVRWLDTALDSTPLGFLLPLHPKIQTSKAASSRRTPKLPEQ